MKLFILIAFTIQVSWAEEPRKLDRFMMDYPHGEYRISVTSLGEAFLYYGASPKTKVIKEGVFFSHDLYEKFKPYLHENVPRENRPNPDAVYGMVTLIYSDGSETTHLIYDLDTITKSVFIKANENIVSQLF